MIKRLVVCAVSALTHMGNIGPNDESLWHALLEGNKTAFRTLPSDPNEYGPIRVAGPLDEPDIDKYLAGIVRSKLGFPKPHRIDKVMRVGIASAIAALTSAGLDMNGSYPEIGVVSGSGLSGGRSMEKGIRDFDANGSKDKNVSLCVVNVMGNATAGYGSIMFGYGGPTYNVNAACASGAVAICKACNEILVGEAEAMVVTAMETTVTPYEIATFDQIDALSRSDSLFASRPFGKDRSGFVMSEAGATIIIAAEDYAKKMKLPILAEICGYRHRSGADHMAKPMPAGQRLCMVEALERAGLEPAHIDYINAHGTSTPAGDKSEALAIWQIFGDEETRTNSSKGQLGHTMGVAGMLGTIISIFSLRDQVVHPMGNYELDEACLCPNPHWSRRDRPLNIIADKATPLHKARYAMSNAFGFGSNNCSIIVGKP